jgi:hypothetical protein
MHMLAGIHAFDGGHRVLMLTHLIDLGHPLEYVINIICLEDVALLHS